MGQIVSIPFEEARFTADGRRSQTVCSSHRWTLGADFVPRELVWSSDAVRLASLAIERGDQLLSLLDVGHVTHRQSMSFHDVTGAHRLKRGDCLRLTLAVVTQHGILSQSGDGLVVHAALSGELSGESGELSGEEASS